EGEDLLLVGRADVDRMPDPAGLEHGDPDLAAGLSVGDLRAGDRAIVALAGERDADFLVAVLVDAHDDRVLLPREVQDEVLAGELDGVERQLARVDEDVVGEEVRQHDEAAGAVDPQRRVAAQRLRFDERLAFPDPEAGGGILPGELHDGPAASGLRQGDPFQRAGAPLKTGAVYRLARTQ